MNRYELGKAIGMLYEVDGVSLVTHVAHIGDHSNKAILDKMEISDPDEVQKYGHAMRSVRAALGVQPEPGQE